MATGKIIWDRRNWVNLTAGAVTAAAQYSDYISSDGFTQMVCYVHFVLGAINVPGGGYLRYWTEYSPNKTDAYREEGIRGITAVGEIQSIATYRELTASGYMRIAIPVLDRWVRIAKTANNGGGNFATTEFYVWGLGGE